MHILNGYDLPLRTFIHLLLLFFYLFIYFHLFIYLCYVVLNMCRESDSSDSPSQYIT